MKILLVSSYLPYPLFSGGHIRLYNLVKELGKKHEITLVCEKRSYQTEKDIREVENICKRVITVPRKNQWSLKNIVGSGFSRDPFLVTGHTNTQLREEIEKVLTEEIFDLIHVETFYVIQNIPLESTLPIVLVEHNIEYLVYQRYANTAPFFLRPLLGVDIFKLKKTEEKAWERATRIVAVSEEEKEIMRKDGISVVPNGVDVERFSFKTMHKKEYHSVAKKLTLPEKELLFIGDFKWIQNRDTVKWIIQDIWPFLLRAIDGDIKIKLWIVGKNIPPSLKALNKYDGIIFDENAPDDTTDIFKRADILLSPIRVGGGTSYKILEAMASGVPVVTTGLGFEGLHAKKDEAIMVGDDVQTIVEKTARLLRDDELFFSVAKNARKAIEDYYDWKRIAKTLDDVYMSVKK
jgi:glycosyltransferase involved in cell wall biosynthesis